MIKLTAERLREVLCYDPDTGSWSWRITMGPRAIEGHPAGSVTPKGYFNIKIDGSSYQCHRLAFLYMLGRWPTDLVDHRDLDGRNNRWNNLREATRSENNSNVRARRHGPKGIVFYKGKWTAKIRCNGKQITLATFDCPAAAHLCYLIAADKLHGEFARPA